MNESYEVSVLLSVQAGPDQEEEIRDQVEQQLYYLNNYEVEAIEVSRISNEIEKKEGWEAQRRR